MECRSSVSTLEQWQHFRDLEKATRPAVAEKQRNCTFHITLLMDEVHIDISKAVNGHGSLELGTCLVETLFVGSPIELVEPVVVDTFDI